MRVTSRRSRAEAVAAKSALLSALTRRPRPISHQATRPAVAEEPDDALGLARRPVLQWKYTGMPGRTFSRIASRSAALARTLPGRM